MNCLHCNREYSGDPRSYYCGTTCRKRAENARARLKRLMLGYPSTMSKIDQAAAEGDYSKANRASARARRILMQINELEPVFTKEQHWFSKFYNAIDRFR